MNKNSIKSEMIVKNRKISVLRIGNKEYISLTDLARYADNEEPRLPIRDWMRNKEVISFLGLWESINNENFKGGEFDTFKNEVVKLILFFIMVVDKKELDFSSSLYFLLYIHRRLDHYCIL